jgi:hypothetical protein
MSNLIASCLVKVYRVICRLVRVKASAIQFSTYLFVD